MIRYDLACDDGHRFDGWFRSSDDFDVQAARHLLVCPACNSPRVAKALMAPALAKGAEPAAVKPPRVVAVVAPEHAKLRQMLAELRAELTKNAVDVGDRFAEEARKIHYGETERGSIYGRATAEEAHGLAEEGIGFHALPVSPEENN